jgi:pimeloyl-ACP methyl ester carboxylesterase
MQNVVTINLRHGLYIVLFAGPNARARRGKTLIRKRGGAGHGPVGALKFSIIVARVVIQVNSSGESLARKFDVPTLILHGEDDQIIPIGASAMLSSKLVENATLKVYKGAPHGMCTTLKDDVNAELLAFIK